MLKLRWKDSLLFKGQRSSDIHRTTICRPNIKIRVFSFCSLIWVHSVSSPRKRRQRSLLLPHYHLTGREIFHIILKGCKTQDKQDQDKENGEKVWRSMGRPGAIQPIPKVQPPQVPTPGQHLTSVHKQGPVKTVPCALGVALHHRLVFAGTVMENHTQLGGG